MNRKTIFRRMLFGLLAAVLTATLPTVSASAASKKSSAEESLATVQKKLDTFARDHLARAQKSLRPSRKHVEVRKEKDGRFTAWFSELDPESLTTELHTSGKPGCKYVGHVIYHEIVYTSAGKTKNEARKGEFKVSKVRRIRELTRYDRGKWHY